MSGRLLRTAGAILFFITAGDVRADDDRLFVSRPGQVRVLHDLNGDGDFFEFNEVRLYADGLPVGVTAMAAIGDDLFVLDPGNLRVIRLRDLNGDGDALDFGEVSIFAELPPGPPTRDYQGLTAGVGGGLFVADAASGRLLVVADLNDDDDALDLGEVRFIAEGLTAPRSIAIRQDGRLLVAQNLTAVPVRILRDRDGDGDYFSFAENISYAENFSPGTHLHSHDNLLSYLLRPTGGEILRLHDLTGDDDVLDFGEVTIYAGGLALAAVMTPGPAGVLYVAADDAAGTVYLVRDLNGDGDAMEFGEVLPVASGITQPRGMVLIGSAVLPECRRGDTDGNGAVNPADIGPFVSALLELLTPDELCRFDVNDDGVLDGRDVGAFVDLLLP